MFSHSLESSSYPHENPLNPPAMKFPVLHPEIWEKCATVQMKDAHSNLTYNSKKTINNINTHRYIHV